LLALDQQLGKAVEDLTLEFSLPRDKLGWEVDQWEVRLGVPVVIGVQYRVVVRWDAKADKVDRPVAQWQKRWDRLQAVPATPRPRVFWIRRPDEYSVKSLYASLRDSPDSICLGLAFVPPVLSGDASDDVLKTCFVSGVPIGLWLRRPWADPEQA